MAGPAVGRTVPGRLPPTGIPALRPHRSCRRVAAASTATPLRQNYTTWRLAKMNLAIRGIEGQIAHGDIARLRHDGKSVHLGLRGVCAVQGRDRGRLRYRRTGIQPEQEHLIAQHAVALPPRPERLVDANPVRLVDASDGGWMSLILSIRAACSSWRRRRDRFQHPDGPGRSSRRSGSRARAVCARPGPAHRARPARRPTPLPATEPRTRLLERPRHQEVEGCAPLGHHEQRGAVAPGVSSVGLPHDVEHLEEVLLVRGIHRSAAGPEMHAAPRYPEELPELLPRQSRNAAQLRYRAARDIRRSRRDSVRLGRRSPGITTRCPLAVPRERLRPHSHRSSRRSAVGQRLPSRNDDRDGCQRPAKPVSGGFARVRPAPRGTGGLGRVVQVHDTPP